ncbi:VOC family protein [Streptomyces colonosanans]|uniref:Bleomycin resistance protein n=1 Tax=Streptomyces colonosanans TaxID=1428652 RepID=A0A1S2PVG2_9ACTN|nr:VOC family protein [Streptomyces colonosanans]OIJ96894.1 bleomycin resistance protein [Streptomyces colonosanans]
MVKNEARDRGEVPGHSVFGAPCWVSLTARDVEAAENFYRAVFGWEWRPNSHDDRFRVALADGVPVAGIAAVASMWQMAVTWTPYFAVASADDVVARSRERGGTTAVGPIAFPPGRAAVLADRDGAVFGVWEGRLVASVEQWREAAPTFIRLHTRDAFDAAIFYGEVLDWASPSSCCEVQYEADEVVLRNRGTVVARIHSGAVEAAPDPAIRPHWQVHFAVTDLDACIRAATAHGGEVLLREEGAQEALLGDPDGARFTVTSKREP